MADGTPRARPAARMAAGFVFRGRRKPGTERRSLGRRLSNHGRWCNGCARHDRAKCHQRMSPANPLFTNNTDYSVRVRVSSEAAGLSAGTLRINAYSPTADQLGTGLGVGFTQASTTYQEFSAALLAPQVSLPSDLTLRSYADGVPAPSGESFLVDNIEIFPTNAAQNSSLIRASGTEDSRRLRWRYGHYEHC